MQQKLVNLAGYAAKHAVRLHRERKQRGRLVESLVPCDVILSGTMLIIKYWLGPDTPAFLKEKISRNSAWALNLFSVIQEVEFGDATVAIEKIKNVRLTGEPLSCVEVVFQVKNPEEYTWLAAKSPDFFRKNERLQYQFA